MGVRLRVVWVTLASFAATLWLPLRSASRYADLSNCYTDHLHHAFAVWVFGARGLDVYRLRFADAAKDIIYPHVFIGPWGANPMVYPPGVFLVFAPPALLGRYWPMSLQSFGAINVIWLLALAHLSLAAWWTMLAEGSRGIRALVSVVVWLMFMRMALNGFFDVVWLGFAAMMVRAATGRRYSQALLWFGAATLFHYRAAVLAPLALWVFIQETKGKHLSQWPWRSVIPTFVAAVISLGTFSLMYPHTSVAAPSTPTLGSLFATGLTPWLVVGGGGVACLLAWRIGGWVPAATVTIVSAIALLELPTYRAFWWHSCIALPVVAIAGTAMQQGASRLRQLGLALLLVLEALVFNDRQGGAFGLLTEIASDYHVRK